MADGPRTPVARLSSGDPLGPPPWGIGEAFGLTLIGLIASILAVQAAMGIGGIGPEDQLPALWAQNAGPVALGGVVIAWIAVAHGSVALRWVTGARWAGGVVAGVLLGAVGFAAINLGLSGLITRVVTEAGGEVPAVQESLLDAAVQADLRIPFLLSVVVLAPLSEELIFRGVLLPALGRRLPQWLAVVASAVAFGAVHLQSDLSAYLLLGTLTGTLGLLLGALRVWTKSLAAPIAAHAVFNGLTAAFVIGAGPL